MLHLSDLSTNLLLGNSDMGEHMYVTCCKVETAQVTCTYNVEGVNHWPANELTIGRPTVTWIILPHFILILFLIHY